jgi:gamma-glutamylcyclotransferase (GGCT)/AIG2-like uncharacterized protein YtfP
VATRLFVYGSLLSGLAHHDVLGGGPCLGAARSQAAFVLYDLGPYPAMAAGGGSSVVGEVYEVGAERLGDLDAFEGHPELYRRAPITLEDGSSAEAYLLASRPPDGTPIVASGCWRTHLARRQAGTIRGRAV